MGAQLRPVYLLADRQLLFWEDGAGRFLKTVKSSLACGEPTAAYVGVSNGDEPVFYELFRAAFEGVGVRRCRMIRAGREAEDGAYMRSADIVLLAGGDARKGWEALSRSWLAEAVLESYYAGALLMGVSAGAVQLGLYGRAEDEHRPAQVFPTFGLVPDAVGAHEESSDWEGLRQVVESKPGVMGIRPLQKFAGGAAAQSLLPLPGAGRHAWTAEGSR